MTTRISTKDSTLLKLLVELQNYNDGKIIRYQLRRLIAGTLHVIDRHVVSMYINLLLKEGYLSPNPTSEFIKVKIGKSVRWFGELITPTKTIHMPNNNSRYFVNYEVITSRVDELNRKLDPHTPTLDKFIITNQKPSPLVELTQATKDNSSSNN